MKRIVALLIPRLRAVLLIGIALGGAWLQQAKAVGCDCDSTKAWDGHLAEANVVFLGTCMDVLPNALKGGLNVVFQVDSSWKRATEQVTTVHTKSPNQCGFPFLKGRKYIVFANKKHQTTETSICQPNQVYDDNGLLTVRRLGQGFGPGRAALASKMNILLLVVGVLGLAFLGFVVLRKKIRKPKIVS